MTRQNGLQNQLKMVRYIGKSHYVVNFGTCMSDISDIIKCCNRIHLAIHSYNLT